jgi:hypothetical protein
VTLSLLCVMALSLDTKPNNINNNNTLALNTTTTQPPQQQQPFYISVYMQLLQLMHLEIVPERYGTVLSVLDWKGQWGGYPTTTIHQSATILG